MTEAAEEAPVIEVEDLRKEYDKLVAVDGLSFTAESGAVFGLLGPNGAGKTTTISCISGLLAPTAGRIRIMGHDVVDDAMAARRQVGVVPQALAIYMDLLARENLHFWGGNYGLRGRKLKARAAEVLEQVGLSDRADDRVERFSGGMARRLNFACGLVHEPSVLLLDEPTAGVDPQSRVKILELVRAEASRGTCVLYTTHYMEEAEDLCDRVAIVDRGAVIALGSLPELRARVGERDLLRLTGLFDPEKVTIALKSDAQLGGEIEIVQVEERQLTLSISDASTRLSAVFDVLRGTGAEIRQTTMTEPSLESLFIALTGKELRE